jgi:3-keto-5-aminohexanoate cleavage enzyme
VNWHEPRAEDLAELLLAKGVGVEAGIFNTEAAASWAVSDNAAHCMRVMIELPGDGDVPTADDLLAQVMSAQSPAPVLLHGLDESCWPLLEHAGLRGVQTRIGLEDTVRLPDGSIASGNADLVSAAVRLLSRLVPRGRSRRSRIPGPRHS